MAGIGLYGVYYSKAVLTDGVLTGYSGVQQMGKAISASFEPAETNGDPLYANNGIAERDAAASAGGTLTLTLDRLNAAARTDLYGLTATTESDGTGWNYTGNEIANPVGVAFIRWRQEDNSRNFHEVLIFSYVTFSPASEEYQTMGESVDWQTPELSGTVSGGAVTGAKPWRKRFTFSSQADAVAFITSYFAATAVTT